MNLPRRTLLKAKMRIDYLTASAGSMRVHGERIEWEPLSDEHFSPLLKYASKDAVQLREFLLEGSNEWTGEDYEIPVYRIGWPGGPKITVNGAKAAVAALRRFYPLRDHDDPGEDEDNSSEIPEAQNSKAVPIRESATEIRQRMMQAMPDWTPAQVR